MATKRQIGRRAIWLFALGAVAIPIVAFCFSGCMSFQMKDAEIREHFEQRGQKQPHYLNNPDAEGSIFVAWKGEGPSVVLVHGSPGSWDNLIGFLSDEDLLGRYTVASVDRPGFGRSLPKKAEPSLEIQARRIRDAIDGAGIPMPAIWVGHSLGGPVVARLALDYPEAVAGLVLVAPSMDPELEKRKWFNWAAKFPLIKWGLSRDWRNSNEEIFPLKRELVELRAGLGELKVPTIVLQGDKDELVPYENAEYVKRQMPEGVVELRILKGENHFIPWSNPQAIEDAIEDLARRVFEAGD